jgi:aspartyl-tRNA synthetase
VVRAIPAPGAAKQPRSFFDKLNDWARGEGAPGLGYLIFEGEDGALVGKGPIAKFLPAEAQQAIAAKAGLEAGDAVFFACDKPDLRNPIVIADVSAEFNDPSVEFKAFKSVVAQGGVVRAIPAPGAATQPRSFFDKLNDWARAEMKAPGLGYIVFENEEGKIVGKGPIAKFIPEPIQQRLIKTTGIKGGDALFFAAGKPDVAAKLAGAARTRVGKELGCRASPYYDFHFCWVVDFPMYEVNEETGKVDFSHNPFSMPQGGMEALNSKDPLEIKAFQYDIVCNGIELSSGAIRNHRPDIMLKAFEIAGYPANVVEEKFGGMLNAFRYGAPPHGGTAPGVDRIVMLVAGEENLREVTMFPMNQKAEDLMMGAPSDVTPKQLRELHIRVVLPEPPKPT